MQGVVKASYIKVKFDLDRGQGIMSATLSDDHLNLPNEYFLSIKTKDDPSVLADLVHDRDKFKLMPMSLVNQRIFGVQLKYESYPPVELPAEVGLHYFRLLRNESARIWERITQEKALAVRCPNLETSDYEMTLYMTIPDVEG